MSEKKSIEKKAEKILEIVPEEILEAPVEEILKEAVATPEEKREIFGERGRRRRKSEQELAEERVSSWAPKTKLGKLVKSGKITDIDEILDRKMRILEPEITESLLRLESELLFTGQSKGKFGGGKRRAWRQTQKKTKEGNVVTFSAFVVVGDKNGHVGLGFGKANETLPAREKAIRRAKTNIIKFRRGSGSFEGSSSELHSIPFRVTGKCAGSKIILIPAPQGTGLVIGDEGKKVLRLAGIKDIYSQSFGQTRTTINFIKAIMNALEKLK